MPKGGMSTQRYSKLKRLDELRKNYAMFFYKPYPKQRDFHEMGATKRERLLMAGNRLGKTFAAGNEVTYHATGLYPDWWKGRKFTKTTRGWVGSINAGLTKEGAQAILLGSVGHWGSGCIPKELIVEIKRARGVPDAVESILMRHVTGEMSMITFKSYEEGREAWQAATLDYVWFDEEPPEDIYIEGITRTGTTKGPCFLTFTPLLGMSNVVMRFTEAAHKDRGIVHMTIDDAAHIDKETKETMIASYRPHEREARAMGKPMLGSGAIFPVAEEVFREEPLAFISPFWKQIIGLDIGYDHPTAAVRLLYDEGADCIHVCAAYRQREATPLYHAAAIRPWGIWIPVAWPHDALQHDKGGSCAQIASQYRDLGMNMLSEHASFPDKRGNGVEAGLGEILERMQTGRFKVDMTLTQWWEEFRMYHRKDGKVIKERDDLMCATRYGMMMLRYAQPAEYAPKPRDKYSDRRSHLDLTWMAS